jgi:HlyD family secretion protein
MQWRFSIKKVIALLTLLVLAWLGFKTWFGSSKNQAQNFSTTQVTRGDIGRTLQLSGTVKPLYTLKVISQVGGKIKAVYVKDGELVKKGQLLLEFDANELTAKLAQARAAHLKAQSRLKEVENWRSSSGYVDIKATVEINQVELNNKETEYSQNQQLYQAKAISKQDLERSKLDLDRARADLAKSKAQMMDSETKSGPQALQEAQAELVVAEVALSEARDSLAHKDIRAPETGVVHFAARSGGESSKGSVETSLSPKSSASAGQVLFTIESHDQLAVEVYVNENDIFRIYPGQQCLIGLPALPRVRLNGGVDSISTEFADKLTAFKVRCQILSSAASQNQSAKKEAIEQNQSGTAPEKLSEGEGKPGSQIIVGMTANVAIPLEKKTDVLIVPISALVRRDNTSGVFVMENGVPVFTEVKVGMISQNDAEITEGLEEGQEILEEVPGKLLEKPSFSGGE